MSGRGPVARAGGSSRHASGASVAAQAHLPAVCSALHWAGHTGVPAGASVLTSLATDVRSPLRRRRAGRPPHDHSLPQALALPEEPARAPLPVHDGGGRAAAQHARRAAHGARQDLYRGGGHAQLLPMVPRGAARAALHAVCRRGGWWQPGRRAAGHSAAGHSAARTLHRHARSADSAAAHVLIPTSPHAAPPPQGKVLFVAPTKPLVKQQFESCREVMGVPVRSSERGRGCYCSA